MWAAINCSKTAFCASMSKLGAEVDERWSNWQREPEDVATAPHVQTEKGLAHAWNA